MRQRLLIIVTLIVVVMVLVLINAASYVKVEPTVDSESSPDRSTFNAGPTGTRALYDFLHESGYQVARWRESTAGLLSLSTEKPATLVIIGETKIPFTKNEGKEILRWVETGGRLVVIDRSPSPSVITGTKEWSARFQSMDYPVMDLDASNFEQMTHGVKPVSPSQPTLLAANVDEIMPSRFAAAITFAQRQPAPANNMGKAHDASGGEDDDSADEDRDAKLEPSPLPGEATSADKPAAGPVTSFANERGAVLADYAYGKGRIVLLSDPYIVANNGINRADNLQLAINVVMGGGGLAAFEEFHQGHAYTHNALIQYFEGTPVLAICGQIGLIALAIVWSRGVRFTRPLPLAHVDRRSSLEFVASMAELQQRAKAYDLALENIYARVRRVLVRHAGVNNNSSRAEIAARVAARSKVNEKQLESLMRSCEDTINGAPSNPKETLRLVKRLRLLESRLGLQGRARDEKQRAERVEL